MTMTEYKRIVMLAAMSAAWYIGGSAVAMACGCTPFSTSLSMSSDQTNVYATASLTLSSLCEGSTTATITAPNGTQAFADTGGLVAGPGPISATAVYLIGIQDGTYSGQGTFHYDGT